MAFEKTTRFRWSWPWWRWVLTGVSALALALCAFLSWHYLVGGSVIGCGGGSGCNEVLSSRWSYVGAVLPVSGLAAGAYLAMLVASLFIGPAVEPPVRRLAWRAMLVLAGAITGSAVWFSIVQKWIIGAFCPYCVATHITGLLLSALVIWQAPKSLKAEIRNPDFGSRIWALGGLALAGIVAACQVGIAPPVVYRGGESQENLPALDPHDVPLVGSPDAPYVVTLLFDYKCSHCQQLHWMLEEAIRRYDGKLSFALCPAPLNSECNPYIPRDVDEFSDSCELAKVALAVWVAKREAFPAFDRWMFSFEAGDRWQPRSLDAARAKAVELIGQAKFDRALADPWVDQYVQTSSRIYGGTARNGNGAVPKLLFGSRWVIPRLYDVDDLILILQDSLAVPGA